MKTHLKIITVIFTLLVVMPTSAHHSFFSQFDSNAPVTLIGTITRVEWRSPHIWVFIDVTNDNGTVTSWQCEGGAPNALVRNGWTADTLGIGEELTIYGYRAYTTPNVCNARGWTYLGQTIFSGQNDGGPDAQTQNQ